MTITAAEFEAATGYSDSDDDLERANCLQVGEPGHLMCGWNEAANLPRFMAP